MRFLIVGFLSMVTFSAMASQPVLSIKKNHNPKNYIVLSVNTNEKCQLVSGTEGYVKGNWVLGSENNTVAPLTATEMKILSPKVSYINSAKTELDFTITSEDKIKEYLPDPKITVKTVAKPGCTAAAYINMEGQEIKIDELVLELSMFLSVKSLTIKGQKADGSKLLKRIRPSN